MDWRDRRRESIRVLGLACVAATRLVMADSASEPSRSCEAAGPQEAKPFADMLYEKREYQRAGECYEVAGDPSRAQLAFLKAVPANSEAAAGRLKEQQDAAKQLGAQVQQAFRRAPDAS